MGYLGQFDDLMTAPGGTPTGGVLATAAALDPEPFSKMALFIATAFHAAWSTIEGWFGIGSGRREADAITPLQNQIGARLAEIVARRPYASVTELQNQFDEMNAMGTEFIRFISDDRFTDGRASQQAYDTIIPLIDQIQRDTATRIQQLGGTILSPTITQGAGNILPRLTFPSQTTFPSIPQAGTVWPNAPLPPYRSQPQESVAGFSPVTALLLGGAALMFFKKRRG